jgi:hypothetical protein
VVPLRRKLADAGEGAPLKLLIMSATLRLEDFADNRRRVLCAVGAATAQHSACPAENAACCAAACACEPRNSAIWQLLQTARADVEVVLLFMHVERNNPVQTVP